MAARKKTSSTEAEKVIAPRVHLEEVDDLDLPALVGADAAEHLGRLGAGARVGKLPEGRWIAGITFGGAQPWSIGARASRGELEASVAAVLGGLAAGQATAVRDHPATDDQPSSAAHEALFIEQVRVEDLLEQPEFPRNQKHHWVELTGEGRVALHNAPYTVYCDRCGLRAIDPDKSNRGAVSCLSNVESVARERAKAELQRTHPLMLAHILQYFYDEYGLTPEGRAFSDDVEDDRATEAGPAAEEPVPAR